MSKLSEMFFIRLQCLCDIVKPFFEKRKGKSENSVRLFQGGASVVVYSNCQCSFAFCWSLTYCSFYLGQPCGHLLGKSCPFDFSFVLF